MTITHIPTSEPDVMPVPFYQSQGWHQTVSTEHTQAVRFSVTGTGVIQTLVILYPLKGLGTHMYIPRGPVMSETVSASDVAAWATEIATIAKQNKAHWCLIEPDTLTDEQLSWLDSHTRLLPKDRLPHQTRKIDLSKPTDLLLQEMNKKTRYNIRLAEKRGTTIQRVTPQDTDFEPIFAAFYDLLEETSSRAQFQIHSKQHYRTILETKTDTFTPYLLSAHHDEDISAIHMFVDTQSETVYLHGGSASRLKNLMGPYLVQWEAIRQAKRAGLKTYDFWGTSDTKPSWAGITRFKRKFGGYTVEYPKTRAMLFSPVGRAYKLLTQIKKK